VKHIKKYNESTSSIKMLSISNSILSLIPNHKVVNDEVIVDGNVELQGKKIDSIPFKFSKINGYINVRNNNLTSFEFLPEECSDYIISKNPGVKSGILGDIFNLMSDYNNEIKGVYKSLFNLFIKKCVQYDSWHNGESNDVAIECAWIDTKIEKYNINKDSIIFGMPEILNLEDEYILKDFFEIKTKNWISELVEDLVNKIKSNSEDKDDVSEKIPFFKILYYLIKDDFDKQIEKIVIDKYDLSDIYKKMDKIPHMNPKELNEFVYLMGKKIIRTDDIKDRDNNNDLFVFIAKDKFVKSGEAYRKTIEIENLLKIDLYDQSDLEQVNMMRLRSRMNASDLYMIRMPKGVFDEEKDSYSEDEIPEWLLDLIDKKKTKI